MSPAAPTGPFRPRERVDFISSGTKAVGGLLGAASPGDIAGCYLESGLEGDLWGGWQILAGEDGGLDLRGSIWEAEPMGC